MPVTCFANQECILDSEGEWLGVAVREESRTDSQLCSVEAWLQRVVMCAGMVRRDAWLLRCWSAQDVLNSLCGELAAVACARALSVQPLGNRVAADA